MEAVFSVTAEWWIGVDKKNIPWCSVVVSLSRLGAIFNFDEVVIGGASRPVSYQVETTVPKNKASLTTMQAFDDRGTNTGTLEFFLDQMDLMVL